MTAENGIKQSDDKCDTQIDHSLKNNFRVNLNICVLNLRKTQAFL